MKRKIYIPIYNLCKEQYKIFNNFSSLPKKNIYIHIEMYFKRQFKNKSIHICLFSNTNLFIFSIYIMLFV